MIESLSSNQFSSHLRTTTVIGDTNIQTQEREVNAPAVVKEENKENTIFPEDKVKEIVEGMNKFMDASPTALKFEFHEKLNEYYVKIIDERTKEVIREIPPKKMLDFYAAMTEFIGLMIDKKI
ncbi:MULTISPECIES: flagellar protein FlaG [unclassified Mesobacillus]|uniref:flagellar protein FlaG n=1 Tax=unclassified Mesobacillus TaxID=2675270 RepID=UPI0020417266|nr:MULTISPECIES: flagellar protein FlaG [unclassified Mesobacillus]MCM3124125.1 flagellar protein FlaG [Mesobacillus sp. MER 33]MCM3233974.1 flagellar protein FlaG [Mesobacillus sp. MER 48]